MSVQSDAFRDPAASAGLQSDDGVLSRGAIASETSAKDAMYAQLKMAPRIEHSPSVTTRVVMVCMSVGTSPTT
jgi:hypothetical protein